MVELEFSQSSFTLSISQHIKDSMNKFSIVIPTTEEFYNSVKVGQTLGEKFKGASFLINGNIGSRKVTVKRKYIHEDGKRSAARMGYGQVLHSQGNRRVGGGAK